MWAYDAENRLRDGKGGQPELHDFSTPLGEERPSGFTAVSASAGHDAATAAWHMRVQWWRDGYFRKIAQFRLTPFFPLFPVTYHQLHVAQDAAGWSAEVYVDV